MKINMQATYVAPMTLVTELDCDGILCASTFGGNGIEDMDMEQELLPGGFKFM